MESRTVIALSGLAFFALLEGLRPARRAPLGRKARWPANLLLPLVSSILLWLAAPLGALATAAWARTHGLGLLATLHLPAWVDLSAGLLLLDLALWTQHVAMHRFGPLWRLHRVHHTDPHLDVTTAARFHPAEIAFSVAWVSGAVLLLGTSAEAVAAHGILVGLFAQFNHANLSLPWNVEARINRAFATPAYHRVHHSVVARETDSNFGNILSIWDTLAGLRLEPLPSRDRTSRMGIPGWRNAASQSPWRLLLQPLEPARVLPGTSIAPAPGGGGTA